MGALEISSFAGYVLPVESIRQRLLAGCAAGLLAGLAMDLVQDGWQRAFERSRGDRNSGDLEVEALSAIARRIGERVPALASPTGAFLSRTVVHYGAAVAFGAAYVLVARGGKNVRASNWIVFGTGLWIVNDRYLIPFLRLGRSWSEYDLAERGNALASHLAYALVLEAARARL